MKLIFILIAVITIIFNLNAQTVSTQYGPVTGHINGTVYEFLGIPFASPPIDTLRWKPTVAPQNWTIPVIVDSFPPKCPQKNYDIGDTTYVLEGQEDCLYLNVWSPDISGNFPVMVFIHGGGNQQGSTSQISAGTEIYHGKNLAERGNVVVVTIQYRLGALGYLVHPGLELEDDNGISGNYGVMDQIFALQWVQNNISNFGGNPANVTIFGESGGGVNVGNLLTTPSATGLFHKAIIQSATPVINNYDTARVEGINFVNEYIATGTDSIKISYMRTVHPDSLTIKDDNPIGGGTVLQAWQPVIDNVIYFDDPKEVFESGNFNRVPLIIGSNKDEMRPWAPQTVYPFMVTALINSIFSPEYQDTALALYPPGSNNEEAKDSYVGIFTDGQFTTTTRRTAQCVSINQTEPVWRYFFTHGHYDSIPILGDWGSYHGIDLFYVFNNWENSPLAIGPWFTAQDDSVQNNIMQYWSNFAYTGNPNGGNLPSWPQYDANSDCYLKIKATPDGSQCGLRTAKSDLWDNVSGYVGCSSSLGIAQELLTPQLYLLNQNFPNPFNPTTTIQFLLPQKEHVTLKLFNSLGEKVMVLIDQEFNSGRHSVKFDASKFASGVYYYQLSTGDFMQTKKLLVLK